MSVSQMIHVIIMPDKNMIQISAIQGYHFYCFFSDTCRASYKPKSPPITHYLRVRSKIVMYRFA